MAAATAFSFMDDQRRFLLLLTGFLTFLAVISFGLVLSIGNAIGRFSANLEKTGIIMIMPGAGVDGANKIIQEKAKLIKSTKVIGRGEAAKILKHWLASAEALRNYIPQIIQIEAHSTAGLSEIAKAARTAKLRWTWAEIATPDRRIGIRIILIAGFVFALVLCAMLGGIIHSSKNIIMIHRREIAILNQIGATPGYIAGQIGRAMAGIAFLGAACGLAAGAAAVFAINGIAHAARVGLMANMGLGRGWLLLVLLAFAMAVLIVLITRRTAIRSIGR